MKGNITKNFTWEEAIVTNTGIDNRITDNKVKDNIINVATKVMQLVRDYMGVSITVNSWFRNQQVNVLAKGSITSSHLKGEAVDFVCNDLLKAFNFIKDNLEFDQLIWEFGRWIHVSYREGNNRRQVLRAVKEKGKTVYRVY